jgi:hypothetical protein
MGGMVNYMQEHLYNMLIPAKIEFEFSQSGLQENEKLKNGFPAERVSYFQGIHQ